MFKKYILLSGECIALINVVASVENSINYLLHGVKLLSPRYNPRAILAYEGRSEM